MRREARRAHAGRSPATVVSFPLQRAGRLVLRTVQNGEVRRREGCVTVHEGVFYGILVQSRDTEWDANRALWERVAASFTIQPPCS